MNEMLRNAPPTRNADFHTAEYELLYNEIGQNFRQAVNVAIYALIANGFIIAWIAQIAQPTPGQTAAAVFSPWVLKIASLVPMLLTAFAFQLYRFLVQRSNVIYKYLFKIENIVAHQGLGWEHFYREQSNKGKTNFASRIFYALFGAQFIIGGVFAFIVFKKFSS